MVSATCAATCGAYTECLAPGDKDYCNYTCGVCGEGTCTSVGHQIELENRRLEYELLHEPGNLSKQTRERIAEKFKFYWNRTDELQALYHDWHRSHFDSYMEVWDELNAMKKKCAELEAGHFSAADRTTPWARWVDLGT